MSPPGMYPPVPPLNTALGDGHRLVSHRRMSGYLKAPAAVCIHFFFVKQIYSNIITIYTKLRKKKYIYIYEI